MSHVIIKPVQRLSPSEKAFVERNVRLLAHLSTCKTRNCGESGCSELREFLRHGAFCKMGIKQNCQKCINIVALAVYHDEQCNQAEGCQFKLCRKKIRPTYHVVPENPNLF
ncbi:protein cbp-1-like [Planococcus citri]|uniref:protein cbp-1-like n=1 Tax=Planococcus citri TaxID=170843 RepID=UPI0031F97859